MCTELANKQPHVPTRASARRHTALPDVKDIGRAHAQQRRAAARLCALDIRLQIVPSQEHASG
eukprot:6184436-Pleurochrysis_carterae.AAC.1